MINRKRALPLSVLVVGLLVVLAGIGIVAGLWSKNLVINGTVETGDLNADWDFIGTCEEFNSWPLFPQSSADFGEALGKDVGSFEIAIDQQDRQIMDVTIHNGYPSYAFDCELHFANTGSIPFNFVDYAVLFAGQPCSRQLVSGSALFSCGEFSVRIFNDIGQMDPGESIGRSFAFHVEQPAEQSDCTATGTGDPWQIDQGSLTCTNLVEYSFQVKLCVAQWNEAATFVDCVDSLQHEGPPSGPGDGDGIPYWEDTEGPPGNTNGVAGGDDCTDGVDNDGDTLIDAADDAGTPNCD